MSQEKPGDPEVILENIAYAIGRDCPKCGAVSATDAQICEDCGEELPKNEEDPSLSVVEGVREVEEDADLKKVPLEKARNLLLLKDMVEKIKNKEITPDMYRANVQKVLRIAQSGVELFETDLVKKKIEKLPKDQKELATETAELFNEYYQACAKMLEYKGGDDFTPAIEGLEMAEEVLRAMDAVQDDAISIAKILGDEDAEPEEDEEEKK